MPLRLDDLDVAILESLIKDGRKSFRQIAREIGVSTPTVQAHYSRMINMGLIKGIIPYIDTGILEPQTGKKLDRMQARMQNQPIRLSKNMIVNISCDYCKGPVSHRPTVFKFGNFERFFCCTSCRTLYKEKYRGRINTLSKIAR